MLVPSRDQFLSREPSNLATPVYRDLLADLETPLSAYWKLAASEQFSFLLESVSGGEQLARYSILGVRPKKVLRTKGNSARLLKDGEWLISQLPPGTDPLQLLHEIVEPHQWEPGLPRFSGGAVGMLGYDLVRFFEHLPDSNPDDLQIDDLAMMIADSVVVFDHVKNIIRVVVNAVQTEEDYDRAASEIAEIVDRLEGPMPAIPNGRFPVNSVQSNVTKDQFLNMVEIAKEYIAAGDCIQTVISQRFETEVAAHPLTVYRALRSLNPSPYMFLLRFGDFDVVGASPEILVSLEEGQARVRPIAGTRWRGQSPEEDAELEKQLLADEKERAEHIMLVDLGRNDLGRVCEIGTIKVNELMSVERYSHVMHIVSDVTGQLRPDLDATDLVRATFPAGTVSGAPKVRAMEIIDELENSRRGLYAGSVGYFGAQGDMDLCISIRTILLKHGKAFVQAGGGIVHDSVPESEYQESCNKARACLRAIEIAQTGLDR
jgi:anthranilate synthase component 1